MLILSNTTHPASILGKLHNLGNTPGDVGSGTNKQTQIIKQVDEHVLAGSFIQSYLITIVRGQRYDNVNKSMTIMKNINIHYYKRQPFF